MIEFNLPSITDADQRLLVEAVIAGKSSGNGQFTERSEKVLVDELGCSGVLLTTSCTHALEMSALLANLQLGDEVIVP